MSRKFGDPDFVALRTGQIESVKQRAREGLRFDQDGRIARDIDLHTLDANSLERSDSQFFDLPANDPIRKALRERAEYHRKWITHYESLRGVYDAERRAHRSAAYRQGFQSGVTWIYNHKPGGPSDDRDDWMEGWQEGVKLREAWKAEHGSDLATLLGIAR